MRANLLRDRWDEQRARPGYAWKRRGLGRALGGELLGASLYELPPGQATRPYHWHWANEELLIVVAGKPRAARRTASGTSRPVTSSSSVADGREPTRSPTETTHRPVS